MGVGSLGIEDDSRLIERGGERQDGALLEVAVELLDLALGRGSIRSAQPRDKVVLLGDLQQLQMKAVLACAAFIALDDHRRGIRALRKADEARAAVTERGDEGQ